MENAITLYNPEYLGESEPITELNPTPIDSGNYFDAYLPTAEDIAQAAQELEEHSNLSYWDWLKKILGHR